jgi:hypothetical protein
MTETYIIKRVKVREAYARNGNLHNPTIQYRYDVYLNNKLVITESKLNKAKQFINDSKVKEQS